MCNSDCLKFVREQLRVIPRPHRVLDVGSSDVNGSARSEVTDADIYIGVDIRPGPGVDLVVDVHNLVNTFDTSIFDLVISTEMLEHVQDWRGAIHNLKLVLRPLGDLLITTRSIGFPRHDFPHDWWRFQEEDMRAIFADFDIVRIAFDTLAVGIFVHVRKPIDWTPLPLAGIHLYSIVSGQRE